MDLRQPEIDMIALARSLGVRAERVSEPRELAEEVARSFRRARGRNCSTCRLNAR